MQIQVVNYILDCFEYFFERLGEKKTLLNIILLRKYNWIVHILKKNSLRHDTIEGQMVEVKEVGRRRRTKFLDDLKIQEVIGS